MDKREKNTTLHQDTDFVLSSMTEGVLVFDKKNILL